MDCTHEVKLYLVACDLCKKFFRKSKHLKKHMKHFHSEIKSKTIIAHNLDESKATIDNDTDKTVDNVVLSNFDKKCRKLSNVSSFASRDKILRKYRKLMKRKPVQVKKKISLEKMSELRLKRCDVLIKRMKIKPVSVTHCQTNYRRKSSGNIVDSCDLCGEMFSSAAHLKIHTH